MHFFINRPLFGLFLLLIAAPLAAQEALFAPYDCRGEIEVMARLEMESLLAQQAYYDSIEQAELLESARQLEARRERLRDDTLYRWKYWTTVDNFYFGKNRGGMPMINDLEALHPYFRDKVLELIRRCKARGIELAVVETYRTHAKQSEYKSMGRRYTRQGAGKSKHQYGLAVDVVPVVKGEPQWHNQYLWRRIGIMGEQLGLRWGGRWRTLYDPGHFEWTGGLSGYELAKGHLPRVPKQDVLYPCLEDDVRLLAYFWDQWENEQASYATHEPKYFSSN